MAKLRLAYGQKEKLETSIASGDIPLGSIILTEDTSELYFLDLDGVLSTYVEKYKFSSKSEAENWLRKYNCRGEIVSVNEEDRYNVYVVDHDNKLQKITEDIEIPQADWEEEDPTSPSYIKNKPVVTGEDKHYVHTQMSASETWEITHNLGKYPAVSIVDSSGNLVVGEVSYKDKNNLTLTFSSAFSGICYCN